MNRWDREWWGRAVSSVWSTARRSRKAGHHFEFWMISIIEVGGSSGPWLLDNITLAKTVQISNIILRQESYLNTVARTYMMELGAEMLESIRDEMQPLAEKWFEFYFGWGYTRCMPLGALNIEPYIKCWGVSKNMFINFNCLTRSGVKLEHTSTYGVCTPSNLKKD